MLEVSDFIRDLVKRKVIQKELFVSHILPTPTSDNPRHSTVYLTITITTPSEGIALEKEIGGWYMSSANSQKQREEWQIQDEQALEFANAVYYQLDHFKRQLVQRWNQHFNTHRGEKPDA